MPKREKHSITMPHETCASFMAPRFPIIWLTGNSGAGKTTLAYGAQRHFRDRASALPPIIILDGDEMRASISTAETLSAADRRSHNLRVARLASVLQAQGFLVVIAVIAPFRSVRREIDTICRPQWIYVERTGLDAPDRPYEAPEHPDCIIRTDHLSPEEGIAECSEYMTRIMLKKSPALAAGIAV